MFFSKFAICCTFLCTVIKSQKLQVACQNVALEEKLTEDIGCF